jgi:hypothetical protein
MCIVDFLKIHPAVSLVVIIGTLTISVVASIRASNREARAAAALSEGNPSPLTERTPADLQNHQ